MDPSFLFSMTCSDHEHLPTSLPTPTPSPTMIPNQDSTPTSTSTVHPPEGQHPSGFLPSPTHPLSLEPSTPHTLSSYSADSAIDLQICAQVASMETVFHSTPVISHPKWDNIANPLLVDPNIEIYFLRSTILLLHISSCYFIVWTSLLLVF